MRAWEVRNSALGLHESQPADPVGNEIVVNVSHVGICGSDRPKLVNPKGFTLPEPWRPGHEIVGVDPAGRSVAVDPLVPCGACSRCTIGNTHLCAALRRIGWDLPGGFAEQVIIPAENAHAVPVGLDPFHAVLADSAAVAIHGIRCHPMGGPGRLAVIGAGAVGLLTAFYANEQGWDVVVIHRDGHTPPDVVANAVPAALCSPAMLSADDMFDVVVDAATGADPAPLQLAVRLVSDGGTIIVQNAYHPDVCLSTPLRDLFRRSIRVIGSFSYCRKQPGDFTLALNLLRDRAPQIAPLILDVGGLEDLPSVLNSHTMRSVRQVLAVHSG